MNEISDSMNVKGGKSVKIIEQLFSGSYSAIDNLCSTPYKKQITNAQHRLDEIKQQISAHFSDSSVDLDNLSSIINDVVEAYMLHAFAAGMKTGFELFNELNEIDV